MRKDELTTKKQPAQRNGECKLISEDTLIEMGFERLPHYTVNNALIYNLGRNRHLSIGSVGTPNETLYICESDKYDYRIKTDLVCLHNYDYDGYLSISKLKNIIRSIGST